jgi:hypothetical protein
MSKSTEYQTVLRDCTAYLRYVVHEASIRVFLSPRPPRHPPTAIMSQTPLKTDPCSPLQSIFEAALKAYTEKTGIDLTKHSLFSELTTCDSANAILTVLQKEFDQSGSSNNSLTKWLDPIVHILYTFSVTIGTGVSLVRLGSSR